MVRFTLFCRNRGSNMRMEFGEEDTVGDVGAAVREALGFDGFILRNGYSLLDSEKSVGTSISEGDTVDVIPDPEGFFK